MAELLRACAFESFPMGADRTLIRVAGSGEWLAIPNNLRKILESCRRFAEIDTHVQTISEQFKLPHEKWETVRSALVQLQSRRLLMPLEHFLPSPASMDPTNAAISSIAFITANRPEQLRNCLVSYQDACRTFQRNPELLIMDDSRTNEPDIPVDAIDGVSRARYGGRLEKQNFIARLAAEGLDIDVLRFALLGEFGGSSAMTVGANRNCVLLDSLGQRLLMVDDDTLCLAAEHPERRGGIDFISHEEAREAQFYRSRSEVKSSLPWKCRDILEEHEKIVGQSLLQIAHQHGPASLDRACDHLLAALPRGGVVAASMSGIGGDSGGYSGQWLLSARGETQRRLWASEETFNTAFSSREIFAVARSLTVSHFPACHSTTLGLANNLHLPPFLPRYANEDGFFGSVLTLSSANTFLGHVPVAVFHNAAPGRSYADPEFRISDLVIALMIFHGHSLDSSAIVGYRALGEKLKELSGLPPEDFWQVVHKSAVRLRAEQFRMVENATQSGGVCPPYFMKHVRQMIVGATELLAKPEYVVPSELKSKCGINEARMLAQQFVNLCGRMLSLWPDILEIAAGLKTQDVRLSRQIVSKKHAN